MRIAIAGASGFLGRRLIDALLTTTNYEIVALARSARDSEHPRVQWRAVDFFSLKDSEQGLADCDIGVYLIHSMSPSNRLSQGNFADFDFILADNFARAAESQGLRQIIYVGGIIPAAKEMQTSRHLASRLEVERTLAMRGIPMTALRCSLIIGSDGSSFVMLLNLVSRLPVMVLPSWVKVPCQPVDVDDVIGAVVQICFEVNAGRGTAIAKSYDMGTPERFSYRDLIILTGRALGRMPKFIDGPAVPLWLSKFWVRMVSGSSKALVYPLIDSLKTPMIAESTRLLPPHINLSYTPLRQSLAKEIREWQAMKGDGERPKYSSRPARRVRQLKQVKSVQRLPLPRGMHASDAARAYFRWLPKAFTAILKVSTEGALVRFVPLSLPWPLLVLRFSQDRSTEDRPLFYITGGLLAYPDTRGRLEFRESACGQYVFAAIHDYEPRLPWWMYRMTQALVHRWVMWRFGRFLLRLDARRQDRRIELEARA